MEFSQPPVPAQPSRQGSTPLTFCIPVSATFSDRVHSLWRELVGAVEEALSCLSLLFVEPILDTSSLLDLSIGLLLLERVGSTLQPSYDAAIHLSTNTGKMVHPDSCGAGMASDYSLEQLQRLQQQQQDQYYSQYLVGPAISFFGSPFCLFVSMATMFMVIANSSSNSAIFAPLWFRILTHQSTTFIMYILVVLFCLESILVVCILVLACHALLFPQYLEENMSILFVLSGLWTASLMASSLVRYNLYQSIGD